MRCVVKVIFFNLILFYSGTVYSGEFKIASLKKGQEVTLTHRSKTMVPHGESFYLAATDLPQTVSFKQVWLGKNKPKERTLKLGIFDKTRDAVKYLSIKNSIPQIYTLKSTERILIVPEKMKGKKRLLYMKGQLLQVESNKPLTVAR